MIKYREQKEVLCKFKFHMSLSKGKTWDSEPIQDLQAFEVWFG